jgi:twitching motility protein PilT
MSHAMTVQFETLLEKMLAARASDLHLSVNCAPRLRVNGLLTRASDELSESTLQGFSEAILNHKQRQLLADNQSVDLGYTSQGSERFRINIYSQRGSLAFAIRWLDGKFRSFKELSLPKQIQKLTDLRHGLVLVTGATGSGKSTTLASLLHEINQQRACHILTLEDPIEFLHHDIKAMVHQRELSVDFSSFSHAIHDAMREDPDVILLGEMRDQATMRTALMAAETGHLVFSTLHTNEAIGVLDRIIANFSGQEQNGIRQQLSQVLRAVVTQTLVPTDDGTKRVPLNEVLIVNSAVANLIRNHKPEQIRSIMETGVAFGMQSFDRALVERVIDRSLSIASAERLARDSHMFKQQLTLMSAQ